VDIDNEDKSSKLQPMGNVSSFNTSTFAETRFISVGCHFSTQECLIDSFALVQHCILVEGETTLLHFTCQYTEAFSFQQVQLSSFISSSPSFPDDLNHGNISLSITTSRANGCTGMLTTRIRFIWLINTIIRNKAEQSNAQPDPHYLRHLTTHGHKKNQNM
jgi:hypothetical protein